MGSLDGAVAVVTGAGRGIGRAIAEELGRAGMKVVVNYSRSREPAEEVVRNLEGDGGQAAAIQADVSDAVQAERLIGQTVDQFGRVDVLVNNAGITLDSTMKKLSTEDWDKVVQVDLNSCYYTVKAALPHFIEQESGRIVNISSFVGESGNFGQVNYAAAKAGLLGFTRASALELARYNVTVNALCPGFIETDMVRAMPQEAQEKVLKQIPLRRFGKADEIARAVRFLVEDGDYMTGSTLDMNGGIYMRT